MKKKSRINKEVESVSVISFKSVFKTAFITILAILGAVGFVIVGMTSVCPSVIANVFESCGLDDAHYLVYKRVYAREKSNENLYNVIQLSINRKNYIDMEEYIKTMIDGDNFAKFAKTIDKETKETLGDAYSVYADSYESYLRGELTLALYKNGKVFEAKMRALDSLFVDTQEMYVYANCIADDESLTDLQKQTEFTTLQNRFNIDEKLISKLDELNDENLATNNYAKISVLEQKIKISEIRIVMLTYISDEDSVNKIKQEIKLWNDEIILLSQQ